MRRLWEHTRMHQQFWFGAHRGIRHRETLAQQPHGKIKSKHWGREKRESQGALGEGERSPSQKPSKFQTHLNTAFIFMNFYNLKLHSIVTYKHQSNQTLPHPHHLGECGIFFFFSRKFNIYRGDWKLEATWVDREQQ